MNSSDIAFWRWGGRHLWDEQQAESDGHGQMSVSKKQHEHPVGVQPRHQGEPAEKQHKGKSRDDPSGGGQHRPDSVIRSSAAGAKGRLSSVRPLSPTSTHLPACRRPQPVQLLEHPHTPPSRLPLSTLPTFNSSICHHLPLRSPFPPTNLKNYPFHPIHESAQQIVYLMSREHRKA